MRFSERLKLAWWLLRGRGEKAVSTMVETWKENKPTYGEVNFATMVRDGYRKNELIYACVSALAETAAQVELKVYQKKGGAEIPDHPLKRLLQKPNPFMSEFDFWSATIIYQNLGGRAIWEKERSRGGQVVGLWPLRPDWIAPIASSKTMIAGYEYSVPGAGSQRLGVEEVVDFKLFDPLNNYHGWPPAAVAARIGDVDNSATDFIKMFFEKGGVPPGLLKSKLKLTDTSVSDIRRRWGERYGGYQHWMEPAVLDSDAEYQKTGSSFEEMGFVTLDARDEARICAVFKVPPILVGAKVGLDRSTYSNYNEARLAWWQDKMLALYVNFLDVIINQMAPDFGDDFTTAWDFSHVYAFQEEISKRWTRSLEGLRAGGITVNEFRREVGLQEMGSGGEVFLRSVAVVEVPAKRGGGKGVAPGSAAGAGPGSTIPATTGEIASSSRKERDILAMTEGGDILAMTEGNGDGKEMEKERLKMERKMEKAMAGYFEGQLKRIKKEVNSG